jgi:predicted nucleic acid-binding protein
VIVADASAVIELLLQTSLGARVEKRVYGRFEQIHAPHLLDVEVVSALRRFVRKGEVALDRAEEAIEDLNLLRIVRHPHTDFVRRAWELRDNITAYDAIYLALAESIAAPVITCDRPLAGSLGHTARIELMA